MTMPQKWSAPHHQNTVSFMPDSDSLVGHCFKSNEKHCLHAFGAHLHVNNEEHWKFLTHTSCTYCTECVLLCYKNSEHINKILSILPIMVDQQYSPQSLCKDGGIQTPYINTETFFVLLYPQHYIIYRRKCTGTLETLLNKLIFTVNFSHVPIKVNSALAAKYSYNKCCTVKHSMQRNVYSTHIWFQPFYMHPVKKEQNQNH